MASYYEDNPDSREEHLDGRLAALMESSGLRRTERRIADVRESAGLRPLRLDVKVKHITRTEPEHGADIGLVTRLSVPGEIELLKAVLVQSKRLHPSRAGRFTRDCRYDELFQANPRSTLPPQWERMLQRTSDAVYLLYGPERVSARQSMTSVGVRVMNARVIKGRYDAGERRLGVPDAVRLSAGFGEWMVDEFLCCDTGDPRPGLVHTALGGDADFPVRHVFEVIVQAPEDVGNLFARSW